MEITIEKLKRLKPRQCVELAKYLYPDLKWQFYNPASEDEDWDGYDVVSGKKNPINGYDATLKIDYRSQVNYEYPRIRLYNGMIQQVPPDNSKVIEFFEKLKK